MDNLLRQVGFQTCALESFNNQGSKSQPSPKNSAVRIHSNRSHSDVNSCWRKTVKQQIQTKHHIHSQYLPRVSLLSRLRSLSKGRRRAGESILTEPGCSERINLRKCLKLSILKTNLEKAMYGLSAKVFAAAFSARRSSKAWQPGSSRSTSEAKGCVSRAALFEPTLRKLLGFKA